jgi:hypothetical protein
MENKLFCKPCYSKLHFFISEVVNVCLEKPISLNSLAQIMRFVNIIGRLEIIIGVLKLLGTRLIRDVATLVRVQ